MKLMYTGFEPFGGETTNPSWEAVRLLPDQIGGAEVLKLELPTAFVEGPKKLMEALEAHRLDAVICVGQAGGRHAVTPEYVAINYMDARIPDKAGDQPKDVRIDEGGPAAYITGLPVRRIVEKCRARGIPAQVSYTAGTYVCNALMYHLLHAVERDYPHMLAGFIHVPCSNAQAAAQVRPEPSMALQAMADALVIAGEETLAERIHN